MSDTNNVTVPSHVLAAVDTVRAYVEALPSSAGSDYAHEKVTELSLALDKLARPFG